MVRSRGVNRVDVHRYRTETKIRKAGTALRIYENVRLGKAVRQPERNNRLNPTNTLQIPVDDFVFVQIVEATGDPDQLHSSQREQGV